MNPLNIPKIEPITIYFNKSINFRDQRLIADQIASDDAITAKFVIDADLQKTSDELQGLNSMEIKVLATSYKDNVNQDMFNKTVLDVCKGTANNRRDDGVIFKTDQYNNLLFTQA